MKIAKTRNGQDTTIKEIETPKKIPTYSKQKNVIEIKFDPKNYFTASELIKKSKFIPKRFSKYLRGLYLSGNAIYF